MKLDRSHGTEVRRNQRSVALKNGHATAAVIVSAWDNEVPQRNFAIAKRFRNIPGAGRKGHMFVLRESFFRRKNTEPNRTLFTYPGELR